MLAFSSAMKPEMGPRSAQLNRNIAGVAIHPDC
jgi:hypothetical protein